MAGENKLSDKALKSLDGKPPQPQKMVADGRGSVCQGERERRSKFCFFQALWQIKRPSLDDVRQISRYGIEASQGEKGRVQGMVSVGNERLKFEKDEREFIPADEVAREFSALAKAVVQVLETLPDILERDCALTPSAVSRVQGVIDDLRDEMARRLSNLNVKMAGQYLIRLRDKTW